MANAKTAKKRAKKTAKKYDVLLLGNPAEGKSEIVKAAALAHGMTVIELARPAEPPAE